MLTQELKQEIQKSYSELLKNKDLKARLGQKHMIAQIARTLGAVESDADGVRINKQGICAIEAGTGTGKTVAYTLAALPIAKALGKKVVISTATVALQEQILHRDLPDILSHSGLHFTFALAKGRSRYLCLSKLDQHLNSDVDQESLFGDMLTSPSEGDAVKLYESMAKALLTSEWDGDRDNWTEEIDADDWQPLTADRNQCAGRRCQHVAQCSFIKAREGLSSVDCVVANHDLVMSDLALGGGAILPDPADTIFIFDEAHHLPEIALRHFAAQLRVNATMHWFDQVIKAIAEIGTTYPSYVALLNRLDLAPSLLLEIKQIYAQVKSLVERLVEPLISDFSDQAQLPHYRFERGEVPGDLTELANALAQRFQALVDEFSAAHDVVTEALESNESGLPIGQVEQIYAAVGQMLNMADRQWTLWRSYARSVDAMPDSRWIQIIESGGLLDFELSTSPLLAAKTLEMTLWNRAWGVVLTSATLTSLGNFDRLVMHSGLPTFTDFIVVQSPFDYANNAVFSVPKLLSNPSDHLQHSDEIANLLPELAGNHIGVLVLFSSRRQMNEVFELLDVAWQDKIMRQTQMSKHQLIREHREQVDDGRQSIIFGLASFAEGVDLPGKYCTHVIIAKLPFAVPNDPVGAGLAEWMESNGRNPFMEISLPEASQKLIQACGRLIRNESDSGQVTLLDKRIMTKRYGRQLLQALPPFRQELVHS